VFYHYFYSIWNYAIVKQNKTKTAKSTLYLPIGFLIKKIHKYDTTFSTKIAIALLSLCQTLFKQQPNLIIRTSQKL